MGLSNQHLKTKYLNNMIRLWYRKQSLATLFVMKSRPGNKHLINLINGSFDEMLSCRLVKDFYGISLKHF